MDDADSLWVTLGGNVLLSLNAVSLLVEFLLRTVLSIAGFTLHGKEERLGVLAR